MSSASATMCESEENLAVGFRIHVQGNLSDEKAGSESYAPRLRADSRTEMGG